MMEPSPPYKPLELDGGTDILRRIVQLETELALELGRPVSVVAYTPEQETLQSEST